MKFGVKLAHRHGQYDRFLAHPNPFQKRFPWVLHDRVEDSFTCELSGGILLQKGLQRCRWGQLRSKSRCNFLGGSGNVARFARSKLDTFSTHLKTLQQQNKRLHLCGTCQVVWILSAKKTGKRNEWKSSGLTSAYFSRSSFTQRLDDDGFRPHWGTPKV